VAIDPRTGNASNFFTLPNGDSAWQLALGDKGATLYVVGGANSYAVNAATGALEKTGPSIEGVPPLGYHELAASPTQPLLFTAFGSGYTVSSAKTFHYLYQVQVGVQPIAFAVSPNGKFLYTAQYDENAYIIDIANQRVRHTIPLGTVPNDLVADAATDRLYVATPFGLTVISTKSAAIVGYVSGIGTAANLAVDPATHACFAATGSGLWSIDPQTLAATQLYTSASETVQGVSQTY
jgi:DNA-binding beta-propeller fold protein YncE